ncbi:MAG TPA: hypothetical protein VIC28_19055 [Thermoanaerobaculia bacterium]|jgi:hypothetical protein
MSFGGGFLRFPDLFPGRRGGEPWGGRSLALDVAGGPYLFSGLSAAQEDAIRRKLAGLCGETATGGSVATQVFRAPRADFLDFDVRGWEYTLDMDHSPATVRLVGLRLMARLDWVPALSGGLWTPEEQGEEWTASVFENYLRVLTAYRLLEEDGAVLHSAGVTDGASAWMLLGPSGAGKTTSSRLCLEQGGMVLSDDLNAIVLPSAGQGRANLDRPRLVRLPFTGDLGERTGDAASYPLAAVLRLVKGTEDRLQPISPAAALAALVAAAPFVNKDPWRREALLGVLERVACSVPAYELVFSLNGRLWDILRAIQT